MKISLHVVMRIQDACDPTQRQLRDGFEEKYGTCIKVRGSKQWHEW